MREGCPFRGPGGPGGVKEESFVVRVDLVEARRIVSGPSPGCIEGGEVMDGRRARYCRGHARCRVLLGDEGCSRGGVGHDVTELAFGEGRVDRGDDEAES